MKVDWTPSGIGASSNVSSLDYLRVNRSSGVPLYLQLGDQIAHLIESGTLAPGCRLPTERKLSRRLGVSRNTISQTYRTLASQGLVQSHQGRGTFVAGGEPARRKTDVAVTRPETLQDLVDAFLGRALQMGHDLSMVHEVFHCRLQKRREQLARVRAAFVECNREQLDYFSRSLELGAGVHIVPVLLSDLRAGEESEELIEEVRSADLAVTTFFHLREVKKVLGPDCEVLGIALDPDMETMVRIARLSREEPVGLLCSSRTFAQRVVKSMRQSGLDDFDLWVETSSDPAAVQQMVRGVGAVIASPGRRREAEEAAAGKPVIEFIYKPDAGSVNALQSRLLERNRKE